MCMVYMVKLCISFDPCTKSDWPDDMCNLFSHQYYQQYYQQVYNQQPMQQQSPAQAGYVQYPAAAAAAQYVYYPQQPFG